MAINSGILKASNITAAASSAGYGQAPDQRKLYDFSDRVAELTPEEREAKFAQFKEMKQAFSSISDEDRELIMTYFKEMKQEYATLSDGEKDAKHAEFKSQMEEFTMLSLDEKIVYLQEYANSLR